ncbi:MAG: DUF4911 domain-containing protein [Desulfovibrio sp.]|nr:DUF4911 domain-containing protein [Desulfovibrio sp.]
MLTAPGPKYCPPALRSYRHSIQSLEPASHSASLLIYIAPEQIAIFRFLLEAYGHTAFFTVLERRTALLRLIFSPHYKTAVQNVLTEMAQSIPFSVKKWPTAR